MRNLNDLAKSVDSLIKKLLVAANDKKQAIATAVLIDLIANTPVDVSEAVSNWQVSIGFETDSLLDPYFPGKKGSTAELSRMATQTVGLRKIAEAKPGESIFIVNNAAHIVYLNEGTDKLPPLMFLERAVAIGQQIALEPLGVSRNV